MVNSVVDLIREVGIYRLSGYDGCPCANFEVQSVSVDVSCHKSDHSVRVHSHHMDYCDDKYRLDTSLFQPIVEEVLRQVDAHYDAGGEYAKGFAVKFQTWEQEHGK
jgi:hypothetical protein